MKEHQAIIQKAINSIPLYSSTGICQVIYESSNSALTKYHNNILHWISDALGEETWLTGWLRSKGIKFDYYNEEHIEKLQRTRLAWLHWMMENHHIFDDYVWKKNYEKE